MRIISGIGRLKTPFKNCVAAIGVFDGVHRGHQQVIRRAVNDARKIGGTSVVVTFHPHPFSVLHPEQFSSYLTTLPERLKLIEALGADACLVVRFSRRFADTGPEAFVRDYLVGRLAVKKVVVGDDFHFGHNREGSLDLLKRQGEVLNFSVDVVSILKRNNINIKTTKIKYLIKYGDLDSAKVLLARPYRISGRVIRGDSRGKKLGYPTANLEKGNVVIPPPGIYLSHVILGGKKLNGLLYIGRRPSFKNDPHVVLEVHILDFRNDLYGRKIAVDVLRKIRDDRKFPDEKSLIDQIRRDEATARKFFAAHRS